MNVRPYIQGVGQSSGWIFLPLSLMMLSKDESEMLGLNPMMCFNPWLEDFSSGQSFERGNDQGNGSDHCGVISASLQSQSGCFSWEEL